METNQDTILKTSDNYTDHLVIDNQSTSSVPLPQSQMSERDDCVAEKKCIICGLSSKSAPLKQLTTLTTLQTAAQCRLSLKNDIFRDATNGVKDLLSLDDVYYHSVCNKRFCAVKRPALDIGSVTFNFEER